MAASAHEKGPLAAIVVLPDPHASYLPLTTNTIVRYCLVMEREETSRDKILDRAMQIASTHGLNGISIGMVAEAVHMSKGGISAHFRSKTDLQLAIVRQAAHIFAQVVILPVLGKKPGRARVQALSEAWFRYLARGTFEGGCFFTNALLEVDDLQDDTVREAVQQEYQRFVAFIQRCVQEAVQCGDFRGDVNIEQVSFEFLGILLGCLIWRGLGHQSQTHLVAEPAVTDLLNRSSR